MKTFNWAQFYSSCDCVRDDLRVIKTYLLELKKDALENNYTLQAQSIENDLETLETIHDLLDEVENNY